MHKPITHITRAEDGTISFVFMEGCEPQHYAQGDVNGDGEVSVADVTVLVGILQEAEAVPDDWMHRADVNGDGEVSIADVTTLVSLLLATGQEPAE